VVKFLFVPLQYYVLKFGDDRLRGSGVVAGQISAFPIDFAGRSYNTLTLPCERVMNYSYLYILSSEYTSFSRSLLMTVEDCIELYLLILSFGFAVGI